MTLYIILQDGHLQPTNVNLSDLIGVYDSNNGIQKTSGDTGSTFSIKVKNIGNEFLGVDANGVYVTGVTTAINNAVATETTNRTNADTTLNNAITAETKSRVSAIDTVNKTIATETTNRTNADTTLNNAITSETANRTTADTTLNNAITAETKSRTDNDAYISGVCTGLSSSLSTESTNRINGDTALNNAITAETKNRTDNDAYLSGVCTGISSSLSTESTNRTNGDTALNNAITAETANRISADSTLHQEIQGITSVTHSVNSDYSTNSGSATKLATARTIWGQSFDGSANIDGIFLSGDVHIGAINEIWTDSNDLYINCSNTVGYNVIMCQPAGNVGIGTDSPDYKLDVGGDSNFAGDIRVVGNLTVNNGVITGALTGNASTATKLATARNIWGQSFDGSGNVDGTLEGSNFKLYDTNGNPYLGLKYNTDWWYAQVSTNGFGIGKTYDTSLKIDSNGNVGIKMNPTSAFSLTISGDTHVIGSLQVQDSSQFEAPVSMLEECTALAFYESSDRTLKENISLINEEDRKKSENVSLKEFNFKEDEDKVKHYGVIAQEVQEAGLDNLVKEDKDGKLSVDYISLLILKISQLENKVKELEKQINS